MKKRIAKVFLSIIPSVIVALGIGGYLAYASITVENNTNSSSPSEQNAVQVNGSTEPLKIGSNGCSPNGGVCITPNIGNSQVTPSAAPTPSPNSQISPNNSVNSKSCE